MDKGYYNGTVKTLQKTVKESQSTIKMDKGYYCSIYSLHTKMYIWSQSTIKMDKGYYLFATCLKMNQLQLQLLK